MGLLWALRQFLPRVIPIGRERLLQQLILPWKGFFYNADVIVEAIAFAIAAATKGVPAKAPTPPLESVPAEKGLLLKRRLKRDPILLLSGFLLRFPFPQGVVFSHKCPDRGGSSHHSSCHIL